MRIKCERESLWEGVRIAQGAITRATLPVLSHLLFSAKEEKLTITGTNLETTTQTTFECEVEREGSICLPGEKMTQIIREMPPGEVEMEVEELKATLRCMSSRFELLGLEADEFPQLPSPKEKVDLLLPQRIFKSLLEKTFFSASQDETRPNLNGVYLETRKGELRMVATDGRRLSLVRTPLTQEPPTLLKVIIPLRAVRELSKLLKDEDEIALSLGEHQIFFTLQGTTLISQLIEAKFPNYEEVIPSQGKISLGISRREFLDATRRVSLLSDTKSRLVKLSLKGNLLSLSARTPELGSAYEELGVERKGEGDLEIGFNSTYLMDALRAMEEEKVSLELTDPLSPGVIRPLEGEDFTYVVMPIRIEEG